MSERDEQEKIIHALIGTANSLPSHLENHNRPDLEDDAEFLAELDQQAFECAGCGWWCEISEAQEGDGGEDVCADCGEDEG